MKSCIKNFIWQRWSNMCLWKKFWKVERFRESYIGPKGLPTKPQRNQFLKFTKSYLTVALSLQNLIITLVRWWRPYANAKASSNFPRHTFNSMTSFWRGPFEATVGHDYSCTESLREIKTENSWNIHDAGEFRPPHPER